MTVIPENRRLHYIDLAKGIGIILVILAHISYLSDTGRIFVVSFHMPLFFIASGMLLFIKNEQDKPVKDVIPGKFRRMMIPYYAYSVIGILIYIVYYLITGRDGGWPTVLSDIVQTLTFYGFSVMWFLPAIFGAEILFLFLMERLRSLNKALILTAVLTAASMILNKYLEAANALYGLRPVFSVFHLAAVAVLRIPICASFIALGFIITKLWDGFRSIGPQSFSPLTVPADLFIGADLLGVTVVFSHINGITDLHFLIFNNVFYYYTAAVSGSFGVILLCKALEGLSRTPVLRFLSYLGKNSLIIMVTHLNFYVLLLAEIGGMHFTKNLSEGVLKHNVFMILVMLFTLCGEVVLIEIINRIQGIIRSKSPFRLGAR